jgi:hypothetical protein
MWHEFMNEVLKDLPDERFPKPEAKDLSDLKPVLRGVWQGENGIHSILYYIDKSNPLGPPPANPASDPQFSHWEYGVQKWLGTQGISPLQPTTTPTGSVHGGIQIEVLSPQSNQKIRPGEKMVINIRTFSNNQIKKVDYFLAGTFLGSSDFPPYGFTFVVSDRVSFGNNILSVVVTDQTGAQRAVGVSLIRE